MTDDRGDGNTDAARRKRKAASKRGAPSRPRADTPPDLRPSRVLSLTGKGLLLPAIPSLLLLLLSLLPRIADHARLAFSVRAAAGLLLACHAFLLARDARDP